MLLDGRCGLNTGESVVAHSLQTYFSTNSFGRRCVMKKPPRPIDRLKFVSVPMREKFYA